MVLWQTLNYQLGKILKITLDHLILQNLWQDLPTRPVITYSDTELFPQEQHNS